MTSFVYAKGSEQGETAALLLALAREKGIDTSEIRLVWDGFEVPDELLTETDREVVETKPEPVELADEAGKLGEEVAEAEAPAPRRRGRPAAAKSQEPVAQEG